MSTGPVPADESRRLAALHSLALLDTEPEEDFDRIARLAQRLLATPAALVSFMDHDRQWYKARVGVDAQEVERSVTFCTHLVADGQPLIVEDATADPRFADNPYVVAEAGVRFYAGVPIHALGRFAVGTLCVFDSEPRRLDPADLQALLDLGSIVDDILAARQQANVDQLTGLQNRRGLEGAGASLLRLADRAGVELAVGYFDLDGLKAINDELGHEAGDRAIVEAGKLLAACFRDADIVSRVGGDEFAVLFAATNEEGAAAALHRLEAAISARNAIGDLPFELSIAGGVVERPVGEGSLEELLGRADRVMYRHKRSTQT